MTSCGGTGPDACVQDPSARVGATDGAVDSPIGVRAAAGFETALERWQPAHRVEPAATWTARYPIDDSDTVFAAVPGARVTEVSCGSAAGDLLPQADGRTGPDGTFTIGCPATHPSARGVVVLEGEYASVSVGTTGTQRAAFSSVEDPVFPRGAGRAFAATGFVAPRAAARFGQLRSPVRIVVGAPGVARSAGRYDPEQDRIELGDLALESLDGEAAFFRMAHEYGHAYHWAAIEPWASYRCVGGTQAFQVPNSLSCAFVEGFAHFFAAWIGGERLDNDEASANAASDRVLEENLYRTFKIDGARTPGVVAAFLYDLADDADSPDGPGNTANGDEAFDAFAVPGQEIARLMRQCRLLPVQSGCPAITALDGIDQFVYCAEGTAGPGVGVRWRLYQTVEDGGGPGAWKPAQLRPLWQRDLYPGE